MSNILDPPLISRISEIQTIKGQIEGEEPFKETGGNILRGGRIRGRDVMVQQKLTAVTSITDKLFQLVESPGASSCAFLFSTLARK